MKKISSMFLVIILSMSLVICPVMAKSSHSSSGGGKGASVSAKSGNNNGKVTTETKGKSDKNTSKLNENKNKDVQQGIKDLETSTVQKQFNDIQGHWAENNIKKAQKLGLINGYDDGSFDPNKEVSQVEAMVMVVNAAELLGTENETGETDESGEPGEIPEEESPDDGSSPEDEGSNTEDGTDDENDEDVGDVPAWARNQARKASLAGVININRFHSAMQASRAQVAVMLAKAMGLTAEQVDPNAFTDSILISPEDAGYIIALKNAGVISGTPDGKFNPNRSITRAEMAAMLAELIEAAEENPGDGTTDPGDGTTDPGDGTTDPGTI